MRRLEANQPLSQSQLWKILCNYYLNQGPDAWTSEDTPSFVTSSTYIANYYAQIVIHALQDWQTKQTINLNTTASATPFYIVELSAGLGEFAFHCLKQICHLQQLYQLTHLNFCYILTDIVPANIASWQQSDAFTQYMTKGQVDFAQYDLTQPEILYLLNKKIKLDQQQLDKPLIVIANYVFDTVPCDVFYVTSQLKRGMMTLEVPNDFDAEKPDDLAGIHTLLHPQVVSDPHIYEESFFNQMIENYWQTMPSGVINFPISALRYLQFLLNLTHGQMLLLIADKGYSTKEMMQQIDNFHIDYHTSLSVLVNFHALEQFFLHHQGASFYQDRFTQLTTAVFAAGMTFSDLPNLQHYLQIAQQEMSPQEYCRILFQLSHFKTLDPLSMLAIFRMSKNDPILFRLFHRHLVQITNPYRLHFNQQLCEIIQKIYDNIYPLRKTPELNYLIGCVYYVMGDYQTALEFFNHYAPKPEKEYEYYQRLKRCYEETYDQRNIEKIKLKLKRITIKYYLNQFYQAMNRFKKWLRH